MFEVVGALEVSAFPRPHEASPRLFARIAVRERQPQRDDVIAARIRLDPNYLYTQNPELYKSLKDITEGKVDDPGPVIREKFGAKYIFADAAENTDMIAKALDSGWVETIYEDNEARLFHIRDVKGVPPDAAKDQEPETEDEKKALDAEEANDVVNDNDNEP